MVSSASLASPLLVTATARGAVPNGLRSIVLRKVGGYWVVLKTIRLFDAELATYSRDPLGDRASAIGSAPTRNWPIRFSPTTSTTVTVPSAGLATYAVALSGAMATLAGSVPTLISPSFTGAPVPLT